MANIASNNLTSLYGGGKDTVITTTVVPNVAGTIPSKNLTTLYSGAGAPVTATTAYGNANVERFLNVGTDGGNTITNIVATGNITADYYFGNGAFLTGVGNSNYAANANFANFAGNVTVSAQPNITSVGNLISLTVANPNTSATDQVVFNFNPTETPPTYLNQGIEFSLYANAANAEFNNTESYIRYRGTPASPAPAGATDLIQKTVSYAWDGGKVLRAAQWSTLVTNVSPSSNASGFTGGAVAFETGNPYGDVSNTGGSNSSSFRNTLSFGETGQLSITQGNVGPTSQAQVVMTNYGRSSASPNLSGGLTFQKARGNRQANTSVQASDEVYRIQANPYNGTSFSPLANAASFRSLVGNSYVANTSNVPLDFQIRVVDSNNFGRNSWFYNDGTFSTANSATINGNLNVTAQSNLGDVSNVHIDGGTANYVLTTDGAGNLSWAAGGGSGNANNIQNGTSNVDIASANANVTISVDGVSNVATFANNAINLNYPVNTPNNVIIGNNAGNRTVSQNGRVAIGQNAGNGIQGGDPTVAIGYNAGNTTQNQGAVAIGFTSGQTQGDAAVAVGYGAGQTQGAYTVSIGLFAGQTNQGTSAVAIGNEAGQTNQQPGAVAVGWNAGKNTQGSEAVAIGYQAGYSSQGTNSVAIGQYAGDNTQHNEAVAIGSLAGVDQQGNSSIAIGARAGYTNQANNSIILNATGSNLDQTTANTFTVKPVRQANTANAMYYNSTTGEITYDAIASGSSSNISNGTSNVSIPVANGNVNISTNGNANIAQFDTNGALFLYPTTSSVNAIRVTSFGNPVSGDVNRIASSRARGNLTTPLSVQPNDRAMRFLAFAHNGTAYQTNSVATINAVVDNSYTANGANIPLGWSMTVNDTNGGTNNQTKTHQFFANGNVSLANSLIVNNDITSTSGNLVVSTGNITATLGTFYGNGAGLTNIPAGNLSGNVAYLNVNNGNVVLPTTQIQPNGIVVGSTANALLQANSLIVVTDYGNGQGDGNLALTKATSFVKARGDSSTPTAASQNDIIDRENHYSYNGTGNVLHTIVRTTIGNTNANANAVFGGGTFRVDTGNPFGDTGNANATSGINTFQIDQWGRTIITQGTAPTGITNGILAFNIYGGTPGPNNATSPGIVFNRYRGNRDSNLSLQPNDQTGRVIFLGANGSGGVYSGKVAQITGYVDSSYVANTANVPQGMAFTVCDNTNSYTHQYYANGNVSFASSVNVPQSLQVSNGFTATGNIFFNTANVLFYKGSSNTTITMYSDPGYNTQINVTGNGYFSDNFQVGGNLSVSGSFNPTNLVVTGNIASGDYANQGNTQASFYSETTIKGNVVIDGYNFFSNTIQPVSLQMGYGGCDIQLLDGNINVGNANGTGGVLYVNDFINVGTGSNVAKITLNGDKSIYSGIELVNGQYRVIADNVNPSTGYSPLSFGSYNNSNNDIAFNRFYRARGTSVSPSAVVTNDQIAVTNYGVYGDAGNTYLNVFNDIAYVTSNDNAGNVTGNLELYAFNSGSNLNLNFSNVYSQNNFQANNVSINTGGFMKLSSYTISALTAITGQLGWMAAVSDSTPGGMFAFWDTTNSRWSYVHDNSAV